MKESMNGFIKGNDIRKLIIEMHYRAGVGHIGSALSISDIIAAINPGSDDDTMFILSKGHAASALYAALFLNKHITREELLSYCQPQSRLGVHPEPNLPHIPIATGSLGMGLSMACGFAIANPQKEIVVLISDAELNEGSVWEAVMFAAHHSLKNISVFVDYNNQQALGKYNDILKIDSFHSVFTGFGWSCLKSDGHNIPRMHSWLKRLGFSVDNAKPRIFIAETTFGKGGRFMQSSVEWHYKPMDVHEYTAVMADLSCEGNL